MVRIFLLQAPLTCVAFAAVFSLLKMPHKNSSNWMMSLKRIDFLGTLVLLSATFSLLFGLDWGSNHFWRSVTTLGCLCSSLVLFLVFVAVEAKLVSEPIAPTNIVFKSTLFACYLSNFFSHVAFLPTLYNIPLYFQAADGLSATQAGFRVLPAVISSMFGSVIAGFVMQRIGRYYVLNLWGYISMVVGLLLILLFTGLVSKHTWAISIGLVFAGYSEGSTIVSTLLAQSRSPSTIICKTHGSLITSLFSLQCFPGRTGDSNSLLLPFPDPWLRRGYLSGSLNDAAFSTRLSSSVLG